ncbi:MAG: hypothetical protein ABWY19_08340 [Marmoricola sp.]|jgi:hypothetical protein
MGAIVVVLLLALVLAAVIMLYVAYPYRGQATPLTPRLGEAMRRGVESLPTLDPEPHAEEPVTIARPEVDARR